MSQLFSDVGRRAPTPRDTQYSAFRTLLILGVLAAALAFVWEWAALRPVRIVEVDMTLRPGE